MNQNKENSKIYLAKTAGYCFGVNNAVNAVGKSIKEEKETIFTLGPIIHNNQVINKLKKQGVNIINSLDEIDSGIVIIRSHGVGKEIFDQAQQKNIKLINATCPYVKAIQIKVKKFFEKGYQIVIIGDEHHPEVIGVNGWCENSAIILNNKFDVEKLKKYDKICVVAQTTIRSELFDSIVNQLENCNKEVVIFNTICSATSQRQSETAQIAQKVECMIVVGGYHSSNTQKLVNISLQYCKNTFHIETYRDLDFNKLNKFNSIGITAGASTPDWIIKEVTEKMENNLGNNSQHDEKNDFQNSLEETFKSIRRGSIVEGEVILINDSEVVLNIGYKSDGIIKKEDYSKNKDIDLTKEVKIGDKVKVVVVDLNDGTGNVILSKIKLDEREANDKLKKAYISKELLNGSIKKVVKGGLIVDLGFADVFMPASQYHVKYIKDLNTLVGKEVKGLIIEFDSKKNKTIFSQKVILEKELKAKREKEKKQKEETFNSLEVGQEVTGKIKTIAKFGIFIDLGSLDGFVHSSDLAWKKVSHPSDVVALEQEVTAKVIELNPEGYKIKLSIKDLVEDPWSTFINKYDAEEEIDVKITKILSYGAFAEIIPNVEGLIHISQISHDKIEKVEDSLKEGQIVKAKIINIDNKARKVSLSIKDLTAPPKKEIEKNETVYEEEAEFKLGDLFGDLFKDK